MKQNLLNKLWLRTLILVAVIFCGAGSAWGESWEKATSIQVGDVVLLVYETGSMELSGISTTGTKYGLGTSYTSSPAGVYPLTVVAGSKDNTYAFRNGANYLTWISGNSLNVATSLSDNTSWIVSFNEGNAIIKNASDESRQLQWNKTSPRFACYGSTQQAIQLYKMTSGSTAETCAIPTFNPAAGAYNSAQNVTINTTTSGATIHYTTDGSAPTTNSSVYSSAISVNETTTIKAMAVKSGMNNSAVVEATYTIINIEHAGTETDPYTVADARTAIDAGIGITGVYARGIVSEIVTPYDSQYGNISYNISADGTTTANQLQAYRGLGKNGNLFTSEDDIQVGDVVVIYGNLKKHNNIYEFEANNQLVSLTRMGPTVDDTPDVNEEDVTIHAPIVDGVRQKPTCETTAFAVNTKGYLYHVSTEQFFAQSGSTTQAGLGESGLLVLFMEANGAYLLYNSAGAGWHQTYFASETALNIDGSNNAHAKFSIIANNDGTFRLTPWEGDSEYDIYSGAYFVGNTSNTALQPFLLPNEGNVDWALVTATQYQSYLLSTEVYNKAQELKGWIDQIKEQGGDASSVEDDYLNVTATIEELEAAITAAEALYQQAASTKPEVMQPLLEEAMGEIQQYTHSLMGKTEFAALTQALTDAQAAIDSQSGITMFNALANLNSTKESVIASVNQFKAEGVETIFADFKKTLDPVAEEPILVQPTGVTGSYQDISYEAAKANGTNEPLYREQDGELRIYANGTFTVTCTGDNMASIVFNLSSIGKTRLAAITASTGTIQQQAAGDETVTWTGDASSVTFTVSDKAEYGTSTVQKGQFDFMNFNVSFPAINEAKYYAPIKTANTELIEAIEGNTRYETNEISQLKADVSAAVSSFNTSVGIYRNLKNAFKELQALMNEKANQAVLGACQTLLSNATTGYDACSLTNQEATELTTTLNNQKSTLQGSIQKYNLLATALEALKTELDENKKVSAEMRSNAQALYITDYNAYQEGSIADENVQEEINQLSSARSNLYSNAMYYAEVAEALSDLETVVSLKAMQSMIAEASTLIVEKRAEYEQGTLSYDATLVEHIQVLKADINASATEYAKLATAITKLQDAIEEVSGETAHVSQSTFSRANLRLTQTTTQYNEGTIADEQIPARVTLIDDLCDELTHSVHLYNQFNEALVALKTELDKAQKLAAVTRSAAQTLYDDDSTAYEEGAIDDDNIEEEVGKLQAAITSLQNSASLYAQLYDAIPALQTAVTKKAMQSLIDEANNLLATTQGDYQVGTINNEDVATRISAMEAIEANIDISATEYAKLATAITKLQNSIEEVSGETAHVSQSTFSRANLRLTQTQTQYNEGTIADEQIPARVTLIDDLCDELTHSVHLYNQFNENIAALKTELDKNEKASAETRTAAETAYNTALTAYNEGSIDDDNIEAEGLKLQAAITNLQNSVALYSQFNTAIAGLNTELEKNNKVAATVRTAADDDYAAAVAAYGAGTIADANVAAEINKLNGDVTSLQSSAAAYAQLATAIAALNTELNKNAKVYAPVRSAAEADYATANDAYDQATIADADIPAEVATLNAHVTSLQSSATAYEGLNTAITGFADAVAAADGKVADGLLTSANTLLSATQTAYDEGSIEDAAIEGKKTELFNATGNLNAADGLEAKAQSRTSELGDLDTALAEVSDLLEQAQNDMETCYIAIDKRNEIQPILNDYVTSLSQLNSNRDGMNDRLTTDKQTQTTAINDIGTAYGPALTGANNDLNAMGQEIADALSDLNDMKQYLTVEPAAAIAESSNIIDLTAEYGTFCSGLDLDFTGADVKAYIVSAYIPEEGKVILTRVYDVPAGTGLVVRGVEGGHYEIPAGNGSSVLSNMLVGTTRSKGLPVEENGKTNCILADGSFGISFYPTSGGILPAGKAFLPLPTSALNKTNGVKGVKLVFDDATGIDDVKFAGQEDIWYTVGGQMLQQKPSVPGIYVRNGKKVVIK